MSNISLKNGPVTAIIVGAGHRALTYAQYGMVLSMNGKIRRLIT